MYLNAETIILCGSVLAALTAMAAFAYKIFSWISEQREQSGKIQQIQEEQTVICYVLLATLDGLKQLGANGEVTKAQDYLSKYINKKAHDQRQSGA